MLVPLLSLRTLTGVYRRTWIRVDMRRNVMEEDGESNVFVPPRPHLHSIRNINVPDYMYVVCIKGCVL